MKDYIKEHKRFMAIFYKKVAAAIFKSKDGRISLAEIEAMFPKRKDGCFSYMQWSDAKPWFTSASCAESGLWYTLRHEHDGKRLSEIFNEINSFYNLFQYDEKV